MLWNKIALSHFLIRIKLKNPAKCSCRTIYWQGGSFWWKKCYPDEKNVIHKVKKEFIKTLLEITVTLVQILLENIIRTFLLSSSFLNVVWWITIFWVLLSCKFKNIPRIFVVDNAVERRVIGKIKPSLEPLLSLLQSLPTYFSLHVK